MADPWTYAGPVAQLQANDGVVTLVDESTFTISGSGGDISVGGAQGLFVRDTRIISRFELLVNGSRTEPLAAVTDDPFSSTFVSRCLPPPGRADSTLMVFRSRYVGQGMREDITIRNFGDEPSFCSVELFVGADFADLFAVKEGRVGSNPHADPVTGTVTVGINGGATNGTGGIRPGPGAPTMQFSYRRGGVTRGAEVRFSGPVSLVEDLATFETIVPARGEWSTCVEVAPVIDGVGINPRYRCGQPVERAEPAERLARWRRQVPQVDTDHPGLKNVVARSAEDLGALRIFDPDFPERMVVAAGAPWFMTVFGRDSLLTAWMALLVDPDLALGVLQTLARFQGNEIDPRHDEQPGRILHEMRFGDAASLSLGGGSIYYGTADATPLFVMLLGELRRWGVAGELVDELLPNAERAIEWIEHFGDADGDGYVEYHRATDRGLANQGWKDSWDGIRYADGRVAEAPIALCEVQAYTYGAYLARAHFAYEVGDTATFQRFRAKATELKKAFNRDFWLEEKGWFAIGLDADKKPIDSLTSNIGHCLWTGIVDEDKAALVAAKLASPEMFSGWGVRTLASNSGGYNPISYHCGSVWPHDTAIVAAGLARYGFDAIAQKLILALLDAAVAQGGRLPELFSGLDRGELSVPVGYPTSCSPQAWSAASPLLCLRTLLRLDPWVPRGKTWVCPNLPEGIGHLKVEGIPLAGARVTIEVGDEVPGGMTITGLPPEIEVIREPRHPATAV
ncbi:MAG TPA: glycogen debranching N-terminal domain-containing protein [Acidimicrobiales bacterium]|nr:glycogen debranching N-terminal domain-containing protein [Acidimicrobiales bacterium]